MMIKFPKHQQEIDSIKSFLERNVNPDPKKLKHFSKQLKKIDKSLATSLCDNDFTQHQVEKQQEIVKRLAGRCHQLELRRDVIDMAENAEELANTSAGRSHDEVAREANALRTRIEAFLKEHRPSQTNAKFLRFAKACLAKAERGEPVIVKKRISLNNYQKVEVTPESYELAEQLYEIAALLYQGEVEEFNERFANLSDGAKNELKFHITICGGNLEKTKKRSDRLLIVQGLLGYAYFITDYYTDESPYPTMTDIHKTFQDLAQLEKE